MEAHVAGSRIAHQADHLRGAALALQALALPCRSPLVAGLGSLRTARSKQTEFARVVADTNQHHPEGSDSSLESRVELRLRWDSIAEALTEIAQAVSILVGCVSRKTANHRPTASVLIGQILGSGGRSTRLERRQGPRSVRAP